MVQRAMGVSILKHWRNEEILEEARVEQIAMVMRRLEWFEHVKRRDETDNTRAVAKMKMEGKRPRGKPRLRWKDTVSRDMEVSSMEDRGRMGLGERERSPQDPQPCTGRQDTRFKSLSKAIRKTVNIQFQ